MAAKKRNKSTETRDVPVHARLSEGEVAAVDEFARLHTWSRSTAVRQLIRQALAKQAG